MQDIDRTIAARALLRWYVDAGVDEAVADEPPNHFKPAAPAERKQAPPAPVTVITAPAQPTADEAIAAAAAIAARCQSHDELADAVAAFTGCPLKAGAKNTVFCDGTPGASLLIIGEAPGRDEDATGRPFVGRAGQLLDKMLAAISRSRTSNTLISNVVYWRPPGNRAPTQAEVAVCRPFVDRLIDLTAPRAIMLAGGVPTQAITGATSITRSRGTWRTIRTASGGTYEALPVFHPAFLLRQPGQKRLAWADLQTLAARLRED